MPTEPDRNVIRPSILYAFLAMVFVSLFVVLIASNKPDDSWVRIAAMIYLIVMQVYFVVLRFLSRRAERLSEGDTGASPFLAEASAFREPRRTV